MSDALNNASAHARRHAKSAWGWTRREMDTLFSTHPKETGETYFQHLRFTLTMTSRIIFCGLALLIHGAFPFLLKRTTSRQLQTIYRIIQTRLPDRQEGIDAGF